jgi:phosphoglycolate phosphatase-like HAD superfamily hydrolase
VTSSGPIRSAIAGGVGIDAPELARAIVDDFTLLRDDLVYAFPGALEALHSFRNRGLRLALVTNGSSEMQRAKIDRFELEPLFETILVEGEWGAGKPEPSIFQEALRRLGDLVALTRPASTAGRRRPGKTRLSDRGAAGLRGDRLQEPVLAGDSLTRYHPTQPNRGDGGSTPAGAGRRNQWPRSTTSS